MQHQLQQIRQQASIIDTLYRLVDAAAIIIGLWLASVWAFAPLTTENLLAATLALCCYYIVSEISGLYRNWNDASTFRELLCAVLSWGFSVSVAIGLCMLAELIYQYEYSFFAYWVFVTPLVLITARVLVRGCQKILRNFGYNSQGFAIIGINDLGIQLSENIKKNPSLGLKFVGFFDDRPGSRLPDLEEEEGNHEGDLTDLLALAKTGEVKRIYITFPMRAEDRIRCVLDRLGDTTASVYIVPDFFVFELLHSRWADVGGLPAVSVFENPLYGIDGFVKRASDIVLSSLALAVFGLPMLIVALIIKLTSKGPVFFKQKRYGMDGREILVWKFRSMTVCENGSKVTQASKNDKRITPFGAFLRSSSVDELPQLFNVLGGSMSMVGPRPHASAHNEEYRKIIQGYMLRHKIKPGITGLAQVRGWRGETDTIEKMENRVICDHEYIRNWSIRMDLFILFRTVFVVLKRTNAY